METRRYMVTGSTIWCFLSILLYTFFVGYSLLTGFPKGGDSPSHLAKVFYLDRYWPHIPIWDYQQGTGYPFLRLYSPAAYYFVFFLHKLTFLSIFDSYKALSFVSILFTAYGILLFAKEISHSKMVGLTSSILYLATPASWNFMSYWGFFPQNMALPFFVFTLYFLSRNYRKRRSAYLWLAAICYALTLLSHFVVWLVGTFVVFAYMLAELILGRSSLRQTISETLVLAGFGLGVSAFWLVPFIVLSPQSVGPVKKSIENVLINTLTLQQLVGIPGGLQPWLYLAPWLDILAFIGLVTSIRSRGLSLLISLFASFFTFLLVAPRIPGLVTLYVMTFVDPNRYLVFSCIFLSILGGFGFMTMQQKLEKGIVQRLTKPKLIHLGKIASLLFLFILILPTAVYMQEQERYPTEHSTTYAMCQKISSQTRSEFARIDLSRRFGSLVETMNTVSDVSQASAYNIYESPISSWLGYKDEVFYGKIGGPTEVKTLARWFGIQYFVLSEEDDEKFENTSFIEIWNEGMVHIYKFLNATEIVTVRSIPTVLVVGSQSIDAYNTLFRVFISAGFDCEQAYFIRGSAFVDDYSLEELKSFDAIIVSGYDFHDRERGWSMLDTYVSEGGGLFIETGLQYTGADWNSTDVPVPCPVKATEWASFGTTWRFSAANNSLTRGTRFDEFSVALWEGAQWFYSTTRNESIRPWAQPLLWNNGHPSIVIGEYGSGRVAWCGLNLPTHAAIYENHEESRFLARIVEWILSSHKTDQTKILYEIERPMPEKVIVKIFSPQTAIGVLFREPYFDGWKAYAEDGIVSEQLKILKAGPDFMYVKISADFSSPVKVILQFERTFFDWIGIGISVITLCIITVYEVLANYGSNMIRLKTRSETRSVLRRGNCRNK